MRLQGSCRPGFRRVPGALFVLAAGLLLTPPALAQCQAGGEHLARFERELPQLRSLQEMQQKIQGQLCSRDSIFAYLKEESGFAYGRCFVPAEASERFWDARHEQAEVLLKEFGRACERWAQQRYGERMKDIEAQARREAARARARELARRAEQARARALAEARARAERESSRRAALDRALEQAYARDPGELLLQWTVASDVRPGLDPTLAAHLLQAELGEGAEEVPPAGHLQQHLSALLGQPRTEAIQPAGRTGEYRLRIVSALRDFRLDAVFRAERPPSGELRPWVLFERRGTTLMPAAVVVQTGDEVLKASHIETPGLALGAPPGKRVARLPGGVRLQVELRCEPHDGGQTFPIRQCLKPDGEISLLGPEGARRHAYDSFQHRQRGLRLELTTPGALLLRTGKANRRGELHLKIIDKGASEHPVLYDGRLIARRDSLFVYSEKAFAGVGGENPLAAGAATDGLVPEHRQPTGSR